MLIVTPAALVQGVEHIEPKKPIEPPTWLINACADNPGDAAYEIATLCEDIKRLRAENAKLTAQQKPRAAATLNPRQSPPNWLVRAMEIF